MIGGVCAGLGDYFDIDPTIVRILFVVIAFAGGASLLAYLIMWIIVPEEQ
jgi:phage shock protein C